MYFHFSRVLATSDSIIVSYRVTDRLVQPASTEETIIKKQIRMNRVDSERNQVRKHIIDNITENIAERTGDRNDIQHDSDESCFICWLC